MRTLNSRLSASCWLIAALAGSPAVHALAGGTVSTDNVKARLISESDAIAPGQSIWVALELDIRDGLAHLLAQSGRFRPGDAARLDPAAGPHGRRHRLARAAPFRDRPAGQLRLCQARHAPGQDHGEPRISRPARRSISPPRRAGWCARMSASRRAPICTCACRYRPAAAPSTRRSRRCSRPRAPICRATRRRRARPRSRMASSCSRSAATGARRSRRSNRWRSIPTMTGLSSTPHRRR